MPSEGGRSSRVYLSIGHLKNAAHFARLTGEMEQNSRFVWGLFKPHEAYAMGALLSSVAFLEAAVNELYADAADDSNPSELFKRIGTGYAVEMPKGVRTLLANLWDIERFRLTARTLEKYEIALKSVEAEKFDRGSAPYQDVALLIKLRNALTHFEPVSHYEGTPEPTDFESKLSGKFALNPLATAPTNPLGNDPLLPFFPDKCLGHGCALWALKSVVAFDTEFFSKMGLKAIHGDQLTDIAIEYASMWSPEEIAEKHGTRPEHLVEHIAEPPSKARS